MWDKNSADNTTQDQTDRDRTNRIFMTNLSREDAYTINFRGRFKANDDQSI